MIAMAILSHSCHEKNVARVSDHFVHHRRVVFNHSHCCCGTLFGAYSRDRAIDSAEKVILTHPNTRDAIQDVSRTRPQQV